MENYETRYKIVIVFLLAIISAIPAMAKILLWILGLSVLNDDFEWLIFIVAVVVFVLSALFLIYKLMWLPYAKVRTLKNRLANVYLNALDDSPLNPKSNREVKS